MYKKLLGNFAINTALKLVGFVLSTYYARQVQPGIRGVEWGLEVYVSTLLFLSREAVRNTYARMPCSGNSQQRTIRTFSCFVWVLAVIFFVLLELFHFGGATVLPSLVTLMHEEGALQSSTSTVWKLCWFLLGISLELLSEPLQAVQLAQADLKPRIVVESIAVMLRTVWWLVALTVLRLETKECFAVGQAVYGGTIFVMFVVIWRWKNAQTKLSHVVGRNELHLVRFSLWKQFMGESALRLVLAEAERFALLYSGTVSDQGIYATVSNIGGLVARVIFRVWEDYAFAVWSGLPRSSADIPSPEAFDLLRTTIRLSEYVGLCFIVFGVPLSRFTLQLLYSTKWSTPEATVALQNYCYYLFFMGLSGLLEAFLRASTPEKGMYKLRRMIGFSSACNVLLYFALATVQAPIHLFVVGNCLSMVLRIAVSLYLLSEIIGWEAALHTVTSIPRRTVFAAGILFTVSRIDLHSFFSTPLFLFTMCVVFVVLCATTDDAIVRELIPLRKKAARLFNRN